MPWCEGKPVKPGIRRRTYVAAKADVATYPKLERDDLGRPTSAEYKGNLVLVWKIQSGVTPCAKS